MGGSWTNIFGGNPVKPSEPQYLALSMTANTTLVWPLETAEGVPYVAAQMDVTSSSSSLQMRMPPANQGSEGVAAVITNVGSNSFIVADNSGNSIAVIASSQSWIVTLTDNTTANGIWRALQLAATTSNANAAALAGTGLQAVGSQLVTDIATRYVSTNTNILNADRATGFVWQGGVGTLTLDTITNLTDKWWCLVTNEGMGALTIATSGGNTINGVASITLPAAAGPQYYGVLIVCSSTGFNVFQSVPSPLPIAGGGTAANTPTGALGNLGGTTIGQAIFTAPSVSAVLALLGISSSSVITESTVSTNQSVNIGSRGTGYVCTAPLTLTLAHTTTLDSNFFFMVYAQGGIVTITPDAADKINNGSAGANFSMASGTSLMMLTDHAGNWWPLFYSTGSGSGTVTSVATNNGLTGGTITASGTIGLATVSDARVLSNISGGTGVPVPNSVSAVLDYTVGANAPAQGQIAYRNATTWVALAPGSSGQFLQTQGAGANPQWAGGSAGTVTNVATNNGLTGGPITSTGTVGLATIADSSVLANVSGGVAVPSATARDALLDKFFGNTQGAIIYRSGSAWTALAPGTAGQALTTQGVSANPQWTNVPTSPVSVANGGTGGTTQATARSGIGLGTADTANFTAVNAVVGGGNLSGVSIFYDGSHQGNVAWLASDGSPRFYTAILQINASDERLGFFAGPLNNAATQESFSIRGDRKIVFGGYGAGTLVTDSSGNITAASAPTMRSNLGLGNAATRNVTISTSGPSGGSDGDLWFQY